MMFVLTAQVRVVAVFTITEKPTRVTPNIKGAYVSFLRSRIKCCIFFIALHHCSTNTVIYARPQSIEVQTLARWWGYSY